MAANTKLNRSAMTKCISFQIIIKNRSKCKASYKMTEVKTSWRKTGELWQTKDEMVTVLC